jgi:LPPG:FO 2-phospho-L-lactate transferase
MITALCGGVGGAKLALGLYRLLPPNELTVIVNTADDLEFCGLHVSPDLDTVTYTLAGIARRDVGWGIEGDTFAALEMLKRYGVPTWFQVGDRDLATDVFRTDLLRRGKSLTAVTDTIADALDVQARVLPMTDAPVTTRLQIDGEWVHFQEYFVHRRHGDPVTAVRYDGIENARPTPLVRDALTTADVIVIVNSNPVLSILPILAVPGINDALIASSAPCVAVSPIVGGDSVSGPAGRLMRLIGQPPTALGFARAYLGLVDGVLIDQSDAEQVPSIEAEGLQVRCSDVIMQDEADRVRLAEETLTFAQGIA